jgi:hypothetical protein
MKLAITQIILGILIALLGGLAAGGAFSTKFGYIQPDRIVIEQVKPEALRVTRWAIIPVVPLGLLVTSIGIAQLIKRRSK